MLLLVVWTAVVVLAAVVVGAVVHGTVGALRRLDREVRGFQAELRPVLAEVQAAAARAADTRSSP
ncbi:hypothetical protein [Geodermatophilus marinus]|uniref:hypothetical protein n=1 Tax=Geodermatophilus sp. LHW52908 TaxID=2303986 RepID=UPI00131400F9|nr:hypothetical protein [Geodermatophilus sp. LHW52908]